MINKILSFVLVKKKFLLSLLFIYSLICALLIGDSWDLNDHLIMGKSTFNYLFSLGQIDNKENVYLREFYSSSYWAVVYFITQFFPKNFDLTIFKLINLLVGWLTIFGFYKFGKILFNREIGLIFFIILLFYPIFFGHMAINPKDTILAFCHIWIFYLILRYLKKQKKFSTKIVWRLGLLLSLGTGIQLYFIMSLLPVLIFLFFEVFYFKKLLCQTFKVKIFLRDLVLTFLIFYFFLILFWVDTHNNIFLEPFKLFVSGLAAPHGWPANLLNGNIFYSNGVPVNYILINFFYKSPEYIIGLYLFFATFFFTIKNFYKKKFKNFNYIIFFIFIILIYPSIILLINPFSVYDGIRLFIWFIPYILIIPALTIYYLIQNLKLIQNKIFSIITAIFFIYYLNIFFFYTPYQYTYLNMFNGPSNNKNQKFVGDYWGTTLNELIKQIKKDQKFNPDKKYNVYLCGVPSHIIKDAFKKNKINNLYLRTFNQSDYIILTNRLILLENTNEIKMCLDYLSKHLTTVKRNGHTLAIFGTIKKL